MSKPATVHVACVHEDDIIDSESWVLLLPLIWFYGLVLIDCRLKENNMAAVVNGDSDEFVDIDGHKVRNYDLKLSKIPRLDYRDPQVETTIANEVSHAKSFAPWQHVHELKKNKLK